MKAKVSKQQKGITLDELAIMVQKGFAGQDKKFDQLNKRMDLFEERLEKVEKAVFEMQLDIRDIKQNLRNIDKVLTLFTRAVDVLKINDQDLESRVERLERQLGLVK